MKLVMVASVIAAAALLAGCASQSRGLVLDPIGPPGPQTAGSGADGTLVVFSAYDTRADFNDQRYVRHYTDYQIKHKDGQLVQTVRNFAGDPLEGPRRVQLPVGPYYVVARANGYGVVTVPVSICAGQVTTVHLEGGASWPNRSQLSQSNPVRLPDGEIAGWRASPDSLSTP